MSDDSPDDSPATPDAPVRATAALTYDLPYAKEAFAEMRRAAVGKRLRFAAMAALVVSALVVGLSWINGPGLGLAPAPESRPVDENRRDPRPIASAVILIIAVLPKVLRRFAVRRSWEHDPHRGNSLRYEMRDDGLRIRGPSTDVFLPYETFVSGVRRKTGLALLLQKDGVGIWLPDAAFPSASERDVAADLARRHITGFRES